MLRTVWMLLTRDRRAEQEIATALLERSLTPRPATAPAMARGLADRTEIEPSAAHATPNEQTMHSISVPARAAE